MLYENTDRKSVVKSIQRQLRDIEIAKKGSSGIPVDGIYESITKGAVIEFQTENELPATGVVDYETTTVLYEKWLEIKNVIENPETITPFPNLPKDAAITNNEVSDLVLIIQLMLSSIRLGYDDFPEIIPNGIYDEQTAEAVKTFQRRNRLNPTGNIDRKTWNRLANQYDIMVRKRY